MSDSNRLDTDPRSGVAGFLTPAAGAIAAFTVAATSLMGQNVISAAVGSLLGAGVFFGGGDQTAFYVAWAVAILVQVGLTLLLARPALATRTGWETQLARAAVLTSVVAAVAGLLLLIGGVLQDRGF